MVIWMEWTEILSLRRGYSKFPEFDGSKLDVTNRNSWPTVCMYVLKEDQKPGNHLIRNSNYLLFKTQSTTEEIE